VLNLGFARFSIHVDTFLRLNRCKVLNPCGHFGYGIRGQFLVGLITGAPTYLGTEALRCGGPIVFFAINVPPDSLQAPAKDLGIREDERLRRNPQY
jgi:hypothetical protein